MEADNQSTADDFEHLVQTADLDDAIRIGRQPQEQHHCKILADNNNCFSKSNKMWSSEFRVEIDAMKADNKLLLEKNNALISKVDSLQAQNGELRARLELVELKSQLASEQTANKMIELKLLEARMSDNDKKMEQPIQKKVNKLALRNHWNNWNKLIIINDLIATKWAGEIYHYGNVMAKFAYSTLYFEVHVKVIKGDLCIGVIGGTDLTVLNSSGNHFNGISSSWSLCYSGRFLNMGICVSEYFPARFGTNDTVGCGVLHVSGTERRVFIATMNGKLHGIPIDLPSSAAKELYPSVSLAGQGTCVEANFGADLANKPFTYNIAEHNF